MVVNIVKTDITCPYVIGSTKKRISIGLYWQMGSILCQRIIAKLKRVTKFTRILIIVTCLIPASLIIK